MARIDVSEVRGLLRVGEAYDEKSNPVGVVEFLGIPVLYASEQTLKQYEDDTWEDIFSARLARVLAGLLVHPDDPFTWSTQSPTGREVRPLHPREED